MKFARYWTRSQGWATGSGGAIQVVSRGWSDVSLEDAAALAHERAGRLAKRIADRNAANLYDYGDAPVPEPIVHDFRPEGAEAVVTRNSYGSLVLNTDELLFADIDADDRRGAGVLDQVARVAVRHAFSFRLYQTAAGHRVMVTNRRVRGGGDEAEAILHEFGSDPLYMRLCRTQQSFRARLTPKPWRAGGPKPPVKFPFEDPGSAAAFRRWEGEYSQRIGPYATCRLLKTAGDEVDPSFATLIEYHDRETKAASGLPLA